MTQLQLPELPQIGKIETFTSPDTSSHNRPGCAFYPKTYENSVNSTVVSMSTSSNKVNKTNKTNKVQNSSNSVAPQNPNPHFNPNQQALIELAKEIRKSGANLDDARTMVKWANEYGINNHGPMIHTGRSGFWSETQHIKIFKYHIPIIP